MKRLLAHVLSAALFLATPSAFAASTGAPGLLPNGDASQTIVTTATVPRTQYNRWADVPTFLDRALGNGTTDDASSIATVISNAAGQIVHGQAKTYMLGSTVKPAFVDTKITIDPGASFTGAGLLQIDNLIPYQVTPIFSNDVVSKTYGSGYSSYLNIFARSTYAKVTIGNVPTVAIFGEGDAAGANAKSWGGNFVGVANSATAVAIGTELDCDVLVAGGNCYGLVLAASGSQPATRAIQIQANGTGTWGDGLVVFNGSTSNPVSGSLIKNIGSVNAQYGINFGSGASFSSAEVALPSFSVSATPASLNSGVAIQGSASGNPLIAAIGKGATPATASNLNIYALGQNSGSIQMQVGGSSAFNGASGLTIKPPTSGTINSGIQVQTSSSGNPSITAIDAEGSPPTAANLAISALGAASVQIGAGNLGVQAFSPLGVTAAPTVSAAGTTQATATALTSDINFVTSATSGSATGVLVRAWSGTAGQVVRQEIINVSGTTINMWPPTSSTQIWNLNGSAAAGAAGAASTLANGGHAALECVSATLCYQAP